jgi:mRNA-degrading endonuclease YafQ of YafQ-DinJ toxin-antitoxin module
MEIANRIKEFPLTYELWKDWAETYDGTFKKFPEIMILDWNDEMIIEHFVELVEIIPFACIFSIDDVLKKIKSSKSFKEVSKKWLVSLEDIESSIDNLVEKYELPSEFKDLMLSNTTNYIDAKVKLLILGIYAHRDPEINKGFSFQIFFENYKKRSRETAKNLIENKVLALSLKRSINKQLKYFREHPSKRNEINRFRENLSGQKLNAQRYVDATFWAIENMSQIVMGKDKAKSFIRSTLITQDCREIIRQIPINAITNYPKREIYRDFFDYLITFMKEEEGLMYEDEYNIKPLRGYDNYKDYKENKVKIIFGLTK